MKFNYEHFVKQHRKYVHVRISGTKQISIILNDITKLVVAFDVLITSLQLKILCDSFERTMCKHKVWFVRLKWSFPLQIRKDI